MVRFLVFSALALTLTGCSVRHAAIGVMAGAITKGLPATLEEPDLQTGQETMLSLLKLVETLQRNNPNDEDLLMVLSQGYCGYSLMFVEDTNPQRGSIFYERGMNYAKIMLNNKGFYKTEKLDIAIAKQKDVPALFWYTFCQASYVQNNMNNPDALSQVSAIEAQLNKLLELDPGYYYNSAYAMKGAILSAIPKTLGGKPEEAKQNFEKAISGPGESFLLNKLMYAKFYAPSVLDEDLFDKLISEIINFNCDFQEQRLSNNAAKEKAQLLTEKKDELF